MNNYNLPPSTGLLWVKSAFALLRKQPWTVSGIVMTYLFVMFIAGLPGDILRLSNLSVILSGLVTPFGALAITVCGQKVSKGERPTILECYQEGWKNKDVRNKLIMLGLIYGLCVVAISFLFDLLAKPYVSKWVITDQHLDFASVAANIPWAALIVGFFLYSALLCVTCFSPMLVAWRKQSLAKAFFFSLFVCLKNLAAIVVMAIIILTIASTGSLILGTLGSALGSLATALMIFWGLFMTCWCYTALWPMWNSVFGSEGCRI